MDRRTLLIVVIVSGLLMVWALLLGPKIYEKHIKAKNVTTHVTNLQPVVTQKNQATIKPDKKTIIQFEKIISIPKDTRYIRKETSLYSVDFSPLGGTIRNLYLKKFQDVSHKNLNLIEIKSNSELFPFSVYFSSNKILTRREFQLMPQNSARTTIFQYIAKGDEGLPAGLTLEKRFILDPDSYLFRIEVILKNTTAGVMDLNQAKIYQLCLNYFTTPIGLKKNDQYNQVVMSFSKSGEKMKRVNSGSRYSKYYDLDYSTDYEWTALARRYFIVGMISEDRNNSRRPDYQIPKDGSFFSMTMQEKLTHSLKPGGQTSYNFYVYAGPKDRRIFKEYKRKYQEQIYGLITFEQALDSSLTGLNQVFSPISNFLLDVLNLIYKFTPNYGVCIIILTLLIKLVFLPLTYKQYESMEKMKRIQPFLNALKEKYKDDQQKFNTETMNIYKKHKINPLSGCFPMLIQIPVFLSFYNLLVSSVQIMNAKFLWIKDLARPDTIGWVAGLPINIMPLLMTLTQFLYQRLTSTGDAQQQKILQFMPLIFLFIFWNLPSGLVLYWTVQNIMSIIETSIIHSHLRKAANEKKA